MTRSKTTPPGNPTPFTFARWARTALVLAAPILSATGALAAAAGGGGAQPVNTDHIVRKGWGEWWLPYNYSTHGAAVDGLFNVIFWITMITLIAVQVTIVVFLIKYRSRPGRVRAVFIHGNTRLEMVWTLIPSVILAVLALASKRVWESFRFGDELDAAAPPVEVLVIGEQFKWNFVYPGKDGRFGQYLVFPQPSDPEMRKWPQAEVTKKINAAIGENPLGQSQRFDTPEAAPGKDDDYDPSPGRPLILPVEQHIAVRLSSKDVIHDFFLPNFRVKLDALPGMAGRIDFTAMKNGQSTEDLPIDDPRLVGLPIWIDAHTRGATRIDNDTVSQVNYALKLGDTTIESRKTITAEHVAALKAAHYDKVTAVLRPYELVCEELCGQGHYSMGGSVYFVSKQQYADFIYKPDPITPTTKPSVALSK